MFKIYTRSNILCSTDVTRILTNRFLIQCCWFLFRMGVDQETASVEPSVKVTDDDVQTMEEARAMIKLLKDRCKFQTHQTLLWRRKAKIQVKSSSVRYLYEFSMFPRIRLVRYYKSNSVVEATQRIMKMRTEICIVGFFLHLNGCFA